MTLEQKIQELIIAVGYALDAGDPYRDNERREESKQKAIRILDRIIQPETKFPSVDHRSETDKTK